MPVYSVVQGKRLFYLYYHYCENSASLPHRRRRCSESGIKYEVWRGEMIGLVKLIIQ